MSEIISQLIHHEMLSQSGFESALISIINVKQTTNVIINTETGKM